MKNLKLKIAIIEAGKTQREIAASLGMPDSLISLIVNGRVNPSRTEQIKLAAAVNSPVEKIFSE